MPRDPGARRARATKLPLDGTRVLSLAEQYPGPFATLILADLGADVVIVERISGGDPSRRDPPFFGALNRNKRSIALDLKHPDGRAALLALARSADVLLEGFRPGTMERLRLGYRDIARVDRRIVYASLSGFGQTGPYRDVPAHDLSYQALAGMLHQQIGSAAPELPWLPLGNLVGGLYAAIAVLAALRARERTGRGAYVDVAMLDSLVSLLTVPLAAASGRTKASPAPRDPGYGLFATSDGKLLSLSIWGEDHLWAALCDAVGVTEARDLTFARRSHDAHAAGALHAAIARRPLSHWTRVLRAAGVPFAPVLSLRDAARHPQVRARGLLVDLPSGGATARRVVRQPLQFDGTSPGPRRGVPGLGEHTRALLAEAGYSRKRIDALLAAGAAAGT